MSNNVYTREVQSSIVSKVPETEVNQYVTQEVHDENKQQQCPAQAEKVLDERKCQKVKSAHMWPQKPKHCALQSRKPAIKCQKEHKEDQIGMLPYKPTTKVKKPGQAIHKDVLQNKNCSNVNIVNMQSQKPRLVMSSSRNHPQCTSVSNKKHQEEVICYDKQCQETKQSVSEGKKCPATQRSDRQPVKPVMKNKDVQSREAATETQSCLCNDKNCQSTRCIKKFTRCFKTFTRCVNTKSPVRPRPSDVKNCQSVKFMWPVKPNSDVQLTEPAVYSNTRKMQSDPKKGQQVQSTQMND